MSVGCLPSRGPYSPDWLPTTTGFDQHGRYHVLDPATDRPICHGGPLRPGGRWVRCPRRTRLTVSSMTVVQVLPQLRCGDYQVWPLFMPPPKPPWPWPWPDDRPPRWWIWWTLYEIQAGRCGACKIHPPHGIDHDHATELVRGLLCRWCNYNESVAARGERICPHEPRCYRLYWDNPPAGGHRWLYPGSR